MKCFMAVHVAEHAAKLLQWGFRCFRSRRQEALQHTASAPMDMDSEDEDQGVDFFSAMAVDPDVRTRRCPRASGCMRSTLCRLASVID